MRAYRRSATCLEVPITTAVFWLLRRELHTRQLDNDLQTPVSELVFQVNLVVIMIEEVFSEARSGVAEFRRPTGFPFVVCIRFAAYARLRVQNATNSLELPAESVTQLDIFVIFPSAVFECLVLSILFRIVILWVIRQSQVLVDFGYPGRVAVWAVFEAVLVGYIVVPCRRFGRFKLWAPVRSC